MNLFNKLTNIINTKITDESLESFMKKQKVPPIRDKKTNKLIVDINRRNCKRYTFNTEIVKYFKPIIESYLKDYFMNNPMLIDIKMNMTHGDILYYESGDFFEKYRDIIPKCPYYPYHGIYPRLGDEDDKENNKFLKEWYSKNDWNMYSLIICLDSTQDTNNGNTIVWFKDHKLNKFIDMNLQGQPSIPQSFRLKKMNWLLFPGSELHEVTAIDEGKMNIKLKFDIWIRTKDKYYNDIIHLDIESMTKKNAQCQQIYRCKCEYCKQPLTYRRKVILRALKNINNYIKKIILDYLDFFSLKDRCLYKMFGIKNKMIGIENKHLYPYNLICSCYECMIFKDKVLNDYYNEDCISDDYSSMCNDY